MNEESKKSSTSGQMAFVLLDEPLVLNGEEIERAIAAACTGINVQMASSDNAKGVFLFNLDGVMVTVMGIDKPLPPGWEPAAKRSERHWKDVSNVLARHKGHIVISAGTNPSNQLMAARLLTAVTGAVMRCHVTCSGVLWNTEVARSRSDFLKGSEAAFAPFPQFPFALWIDLQMFSDKANNGVVALTFGLKHFVGREVEFFTKVSDQAALLNRVYGLAAYLLQNGAIVKNGDTIGISESEHIKVVTTRSKRFFGLSVYLTQLEVA
jgi:Domain of unknown function (DUF4261)